jgi:chromosome segregation ATPase
MSHEGDAEGLRDRLTTRGEDALGKLAQDLLENPLISGAISRAFEAREKAAQAQEVAMGALNIPSAGDIERLTRRLRSVSQRMEGLEDGIDRIERSMSRLTGGESVESRLASIEEQLAGLRRQLDELRERLPGAEPPLPRGQERLNVEPSEAGSAFGSPPVSGARAGTSARRGSGPRRASGAAPASGAPSSRAR